MKKRLLLVCLFLTFVLGGCGRNNLIEGTYVNNTDDFIGEFVITHEGNSVSVTINGQEYNAEMEDKNLIFVEEQYYIYESYCDSEGNPDIKDCKKDFIKVPDAKSWIEGEYEVDDEGALNLMLDKQ